MSKLKRIHIEFSEGMVLKKKVVEDVEILGENDKYLVIDDYFFTKLQKEEERGYNLYSTVESVNISNYSNDNTMMRLMGLLRIELYTTSSLKVAENKINRELNKYIKGKLGMYGDGSKIKISLED